MRMSFLATALAVVSAGSAMAGTVPSVTGYGLSGSGSKLVVYGDLGKAGGATKVSLQGGKVDGIAFRPVTGELYGYQIGKGTNPDKVFLIDTKTGQLTDTGATSGEGATVRGGKIGFDFNNQIDAARVVSTKRDNLVFFPDSFPSASAGTVQRFTDPFYAEGDTNAGVNPLIFANAYTNAINGETASTTFQYALDARTDSLVSLANNAGTLETVAPITMNGKALDFTKMGGFDIVSPAEGDNTAFALLTLRKGKGSGIYEIDLENGIASYIASAGKGRFNGFAASTSTPAPVPLPASAALMLGAVAGLGALRFRRRRAPS